MLENYHVRLGECSAKFWCVRSLITVLHSAALNLEAQNASSEVTCSVLLELILDKMGEGLEELDVIEGELHCADEKHV